MRPIKFRAWDKVTEQMIFVQQITFDYDCSSIEEVVGYTWHRITGYGDKVLLECNSNIVLMQSTDLFDKNGKEIWEGDIVKDVSKDSEDDLHFFEGCVKYLAPHFVLETKPNFSIGMRNVPSEYEVIGNMYENPDLLKNYKF